MSQIPITYYIDWTGLEDFKSYTYDINGIPQVNKIGKAGLYYNPITIAQYGLFLLGLWEKSGDEAKKKLALKCGDWLVQNSQFYKIDSIVWSYNFDLLFYNRKAPWYSAMAQGEVVSLLLRLNILKKNAKYVETAQKAINVFRKKTKELGLVEWIDKGCAVFQEYPTNPPSHVLNGHIFALLGVWDYARFFQDPEMIELAACALNSIERKWDLWDTGFWTRYDLFVPHRLASPMYHELHIRQIKVLAELFNKSGLLEIVDRWSKYQKSPLSKTRWFFGKVNEKWKLRGKLS